LSVLDDIIVEGLITDNTARRFWREKCGDKVKLPWKNFMTAFACTLSAPYLLFHRHTAPKCSLAHMLGLMAAYVHEKQRPFLPLTPEAELKLACLKQLVGTSSRHRRAPRDPPLTTVCS
jgi:hypothetical protein